MIQDINLNSHIDKSIKNIISTLQEQGHETYIVGGAIRDLLLKRTPKDFDISTSARPEEIRAILGRRKTRIIGRRFRIVHYFLGREVIEISTFRGNPDLKEQHHNGMEAEVITNDNSYGTAEEDAWRRDFTVNSIFYDPSNGKVIDHTNLGIEDLKNKVVRIIGDPQTRFAEDPIRVLRALKLVGQFGFKVEKETETAMISTYENLALTSISRRSLELEKVLAKEYAYSILKTFNDYGFLRHFMPSLQSQISTVAAEIGFSLLKIDCEKLSKENSDEYISVSIAILALPFVAAAFSGTANKFEHKYEYDDKKGIRKIIWSLFTPLVLPRFITEEATEIIFLLHKLFNSDYHKKLRKHRLLYDICRVGTIINDYQYNDEAVSLFCHKTLNSERYY